MSNYDFAFNPNEKNDSTTKLTAYIPPGSTVLEFGPARGRMTKYLQQEMGCKVYIVELNQEDYEEAKRYAQKGVCGDIMDFAWVEAFQGTKFDVILFCDVLEHLYDPAKAVKKSSELLKEDGILLVSLPNVAHNDVIYNLYRDQFHYRKTGLLDQTHIRFFAHENLEEFFDQTGFGIVEEDAVILNTAHTELMDDQRVLDPFLTELKKRPFGDVYQFVLKLQKKEYIAAHSIEKKSTLHTAQRNLLGKIYFDTGSGFGEDNAETFLTNSNFSCQVKLPSGTKRVRFDPVEGYACAVFDCILRSNQGICQMSNANGMTLGSAVVFQTKDPWLEFELPAGAGEWLEIQARIELIDSAGLQQLFSNFTLLEEQKQALSGKEEEIAFFKGKDEVYQKELKDYKREISNLTAQLEKTRCFLAQSEEKEQQLGQMLEEKKQAVLEMEEELRKIETLIEEKQSQIEGLEEKNQEYETLLEEERSSAQIAQENYQTAQENYQHAQENYQKTLENYRTAQGNYQTAQQQFLIYRDQYLIVVNSTCWKITKPVRLTLDAVKRIPYLGKTLKYLRHYGLRATLKKIRAKLRRKPKLPEKIQAPRLNLIDMDKEEELDITVSVVIPTKNGGEEFESLLKTLRTQKHLKKKVEIVIVDSGSTDRTLAIAKEYGAKIIQIKPSEFSHSYARNLGAKNASGEYLLIMTQDAMPTGNQWIYHLYLALTCRENIGAVSCAEFVREDADLYYRAFTAGHYAFLRAWENDAIFTNPGTNDTDEVRKNANISDITCFFRRDVFFQYQYRGKFAEDLDLGMRMIRDGYQLVLLSSDMVIHSHTRNPFYYLKRRFVEYVTLKEMFPDYPFVPYTYRKTMIEGAFVFDQLRNLIAVTFLEGGAVSLDEFEQAFYQNYRKIRQKCYPKQIQPAEQDAYLDGNSVALINQMIDFYHKEAKAQEQYDGNMIDALEGYLNTVFWFMRSCYEVVNEELLEEFFQCIFQLYTSVIGTCFAYSYFNKEDKNRYLDFYSGLGVGI